MEYSILKYVLIYVTSFCLLIIAATVSFYFLKIIPDQNKEGLSLQAEEIRMKQEQINLEKSKIEIQDRETVIKEQNHQRQESEINRKTTEVSKCEASRDAVLKQSYNNAGCSNIKGDCKASEKDGEIISAWIQICNELKTKYNL